MWTAIWVVVAIVLAATLAYVVSSNQKQAQEAAAKLEAAGKLDAAQARAQAQAAVQAQSSESQQSHASAASGPQKQRSALDVSAAQLARYLGDAERAAVVMFHSPHCGHCVAMKPAYEKYGKAAGDKVHVLRVDCEEFPQVAERFGIRGFPTVKRFEGGRETGEYEGDRTAGSLLAFASGH